MSRTLQYVAMIPISIGNERNKADVVPAQAGISVFQQPAAYFGLYPIKQPHDLILKMQILFGAIKNLAHKKEK